MINLKELKQNMTPEDIIELVTKLGANRYIKRNEYIIFPTICHNPNPDLAADKLYYYYDSQIFRCYTACNESFDIYGLIERRLKLLYPNKVITFRNILEFIVKSFDVKAAASLETKYQKIAERYRPKQPKELVAQSNTVLSAFTKYYPPEWLQEGISKKSMDKYNILYSISQNKIVIPHYEPNGELIGVRGRTLDKDEIAAGRKYMPIQVEGKYMAHPLGFNLYGLNVSKKDINKAKVALFFESEKSCMMCDTYFNKNLSVAVCGSSISRAQVKQLLKVCPKVEEIVICFDKEYTEKDIKKKDKYFNKLYSLGKKYNDLVNFSFIFDTNGLLKEKDSPIDRGKGIFLKLFKQRKQVK